MSPAMLTHHASLPSPALLCRYDSVHDDDERVRRGLLRLLGQPRMHYWGLIDQLLFMEQAL